jgi:hypothetical protein
VWKKTPSRESNEYGGTLMTRRMLWTLMLILLLGFAEQRPLESYTWNE